MKINSYKPTFCYWICLCLFFVVYNVSCVKEKDCTLKEWYEDVDNDGLGNPDKNMLACEKPPGYVDNGQDDNDSIEPMNQNIVSSIASTNIGESYPVRIFLPANYEDNNLPVLYVLDGKTYYENVINWVEEIELEAIIVGIGDHLETNMNDLRRRDFLPGFSYNNATDGYLKFYKFLTEEVIPYIDENYLNNPEKRTLIGHHAAGLFTNFSVIATGPEIQPFFGFISVNSEIFNFGILRDLADNLEFSDAAKRSKLSMSQVSSSLKAEWFLELLEEKDYPWLDINVFTIENENTSAFIPEIVEPSVKNGLAFIY